ncbi:zinc ribbon domain-containing protein [Mycolicibacterium flavescens]|nr:zinc ribbon domain-containing protein [Mycolicibacterium flavescens]
MHSCPAVVKCPQCHGDARKLMSSPHLGRTGVAMRLHDATRATAERPNVVAAPPPAARRQNVTANPLHRKLPRN